ERATEVEARNIQPELGFPLAGAVQEVVVRRVSFVAVELPDRSVELPRAGLDHHGNGAAGTNSIIRSVVAVERLEFGECIDRWQGTEATTATAIVEFATVQQVDIVCRARPVEADAVCAGQCVDT